MKENTKIGISMAAVLTVILSFALGIFWLESKNQARHQVWRDYFAGCEFKGSRINHGFRAHTVYIYDCNGRTEETFYQPRTSK